MILVDLSQVVISNAMQQHVSKKVPVEEGMLRHMILSQLTSIALRYGRKYGSIVLAVDGYRYWRRDKFKYYKGHRKAAREASDFDWDKFFKFYDQIRNEIEGTLPCKVIRLDLAEADDIIAVLSKVYHRYEPILIWSSDKDFGQLQKYPGVTQYSYIHKKELKIEDPILHLNTLIVEGDTGDGIPNILSDDDTVVNPDKRQKRLTKKIRDRLLSGYSPERQAIGKEELAGIERNRALIDFDYIPKEIEDIIIKAYNEAPVGDINKTMMYMMDKKLARLLADVHAWEYTGAPVKAFTPTDSGKAKKVGGFIFS